MAIDTENYVDITSNVIPGIGGAPGPGESPGGGNSNNPVLTVNGVIPNQYGDLTVEFEGAQQLTNAEVIAGTDTAARTISAAQAKLAAQTWAPAAPPALSDAAIVAGTATTPSTITAAQAKLAAKTHGHGGTAAVGASRALTVADDQQTLVVNSASAVALTIPNDSTVAWADGAFITLYQAGAGVPAFVAGPGVTLQNPTLAVASSAQPFLSVARVAANTWAVVA